MLIVLMNVVVAALALLLFRQDNIWNIVPLIIIIVVNLVISELGMNSTVNNVKQELEMKFPNKEFKDYQVDYEFIPDITLSFYGVVYYILIAFFAYELYIGAINHNIIFRLLLPMVLLIIYDIIFASRYCYKQVTNKSNVLSFLIYHESRFMHKATFVLMAVIGILMCIPLAILAAVLMVLKFFT